MHRLPRPGRPPPPIRARRAGWAFRTRPTAGRRRGALDLDPTREDDVEAVGALARHQDRRAAIDLEEAEALGELDPLLLLERAEQRARAREALDQAIADEAEHDAEDVGVLADHLAHRHPVDLDQLGRRDRGDRRGARPLGDEGHLAEEAARTDAAHLDAGRAFRAERHLALADDEQRVAGIALAEHDGADRQGQHLHVLDQRLELLPREAGEQGGLAERAPRGRAEQARRGQRRLLEVGQVELLGVVELVVVHLVRAGVIDDVHRARLHRDVVLLDRAVGGVAERDDLDAGLAAVVAVLVRAGHHGRERHLIERGAVRHLERRRRDLVAAAAAHADLVAGPRPRRDDHLDVVGVGAGAVGEARELGRRRDAATGAARRGDRARPHLRAAAERRIAGPPAARLRQRRPDARRAGLAERRQLGRVPPVVLVDRRRPRVRALAQRGDGRHVVERDVALDERADPRVGVPLLLVDRGEPALGREVRRVELQDHLAHRDRLDQEAALGVAVGGAVVGGDRLLLLAEPAQHLRGALGPLRVVGLHALEVEVALQGALVLAGGGRGSGVLPQRSSIARSHGRGTITRTGPPRRCGGSRSRTYACSRRAR